VAPKKKDPYRFFKIEAKELLEQLNQGFLAIEENPEDLSPLDTLFRHAHTLKGSSRLVKLSNIGDIAHFIEDILGSAKSGKTKPSSETIDLFLKGLDKIQTILDRVNKGEDPHTDVSLFLEQMKEGLYSEDTKTTPPEPVHIPPSHASTPARFKTDPVDGNVAKPLPRPAGEMDLHMAPKPEPLPMAKPEIEPEIDPEPKPEPKLEPKLEPKPEPKPEPKIDDETIRVDIKKLNTMLTLSGELVINKIKLQEKIHQLNELKRLSETGTAHAEAWARIEDIPDIQVLKENNHEMKETLSHMKQCFQAQQQLKEALYQFSLQYEQDITLTHLITMSLQESAFNARLLPADTMLSEFKRLVRDIAKELEKDIQLQIIGGDLDVDKHILDEMHSPLMHLIRNAADHGMESPDERSESGKNKTGTLTLTLEQQGSGLVIICEDDGRGIDIEHIRSTAIQKKIISEKAAGDMTDKELLYLILTPGFSTSEMVTSLSGRGVGLDVVAAAAERLRGTVSIASEPGRFTRFSIHLPRSLANLPCLLFVCGHEKLLLPLSAVKETFRIVKEQIEMEGNREVIRVDGKATPLVMLNRILRLPEDKTNHEKIPVVVVSSLDERVAFSVSRLIGVREIVVKNLGNHIKKIENIGGATILGDGRPVIILDPAQLIRHAKGTGKQDFNSDQDSGESTDMQLPILIIDDSLTTRMMEKSILESAGYPIDLAVSGEDALEKTKQHHYALLIVDVEMPGISGFEFLSRFYETNKYPDTPSIVVSSLATMEMKRKGLASGAKAYIVKGEFDQGLFLEMVESLI